MWRFLPQMLSGYYLNYCLNYWLIDCNQLARFMQFCWSFI
ncbi:hypothetical protein AO381_1268 [Moraxella catarrhalis]|nr:hypothetical protein AO381_1268 [Moraxella catarrhalis]